MGVYLLKIPQFKESSSYLDLLEISHLCMQESPMDPTAKITEFMINELGKLYLFLGR